MMGSFLNAMKQQAEMMQSHRAEVRVALVTSYDPDNYCAKVAVQPKGTESGWLPITSPWIGNGWGMFAPPSVGDLVELHFQEDDFNAGFIVCRFYNDVDRPVSIPSGEFYLIHKSGSFLKFMNNGDVQLTTNHDLIAHVGHDLTSTVARDVSLAVTRNVSATVGGNMTLAVTGTITSSATSWTHAGPLTVNGPITGTQGIGITGSYGGGPTCYFTGVMHFNGVQITADGGSTQTFNGKRIDDTLRVDGGSIGPGTSGNPV